jgi:hypothetical protein
VDDVKLRISKEVEGAKKEKESKNIQQQVFAGGHPPNY